MPLRIVELSGLPKDKLNELSEYLSRTFSLSVSSRSQQIEGKLRQWLDNYDAKPQQAVRSSPFPNASNFMPQLIRMHTDILTARVIGILFGTRPFWRPTTFLEGGSIGSAQLQSLGAWMQHICFHRINMYPTIDTIVHEGFKLGTVVCKKWWDEQTLYTVGGTYEDNKLREASATVSDVKLDTVPFEDFFPYPITAKRIEFCEICFHRLRLTESDVKWRQSNRVWNEEACNLLLNGKGSVGGSSTSQQSLQTTGITLTPDVGRPYDAIEAHLTYELTPGKRYPIVVVFNPKIRGPLSILRAYYKPGSNPFLNAFTDFRFMPRSDSFYGDCIPQILEDSQEEQAQIHNARRDSNTIANVPAWKKKRYADVANPSTEWYPGKVFEVDNMDDLVPLQFAGNYNSMVDEENFLLTLAERYTGVSPAMQGFGSGVNGKRGTYASQGTLAMIAEGNRRIDVYLKRCRHPFNSLGQFIYTAYRDFGDLNDWKAWGTHAQNLALLFSADSALVGGNTFFELSASDAGANRETDRSGLLLMANTMSAYYNQLAQAAQTILSIPQGSPFQNLLLEILDGARDLANRLLFVFDIGDREKLLPDLRKVLAGGQAGQGGSGAGPGSTLLGGLPESPQDVSVGGIQNLSQQLTSLTRGMRSGVTQ
jgi:hypothetical protein